MQSTLCSVAVLLLFAGIASAGTWCLEFDGIDDWVEIPASPLDNSDPSQGFTCEGWVKVNLVDGWDWDVIFHNGPFAEFSIDVDQEGV